MASPQWTILSSVKSVLEGLAGLSGVTVSIRERPFHSSDHSDSLPFVCVSPGREKPIKYYMPLGVWFDWPVTVTLFQAKDGAVQSSTDLQWRINRRWEIFQALGLPTLSGASTVFDFTYEPDPVIDLQGLDGHLKVTSQQFTFRSNQTRGGGG